MARCPRLSEKWRGGSSHHRGAIPSRHGAEPATATPEPAWSGVWVVIRNAGADERRQVGRSDGGFLDAFRAASQESGLSELEAGARPDKAVARFETGSMLDRHGVQRRCSIPQSRRGRTLTHHKSVRLFPASVRRTPLTFEGTSGLGATLGTLVPQD